MRPVPPHPPIMAETLLHIDGAMGEGGGQILRTALSLSLCLGRPFRISNLRAARRRPGLRAQHLAAVRAAAEIGGARVAGAGLGSRALSFVPGAPRPGDYHFDVGTAGSTTLVLQTVLPALLQLGAPSRLLIEGGTHNPRAPPFEFLQSVFLPLIRRMGPRVEAALDRYGFYPRGGGRIRVQVRPCEGLQPLYLLERGRVVSMAARVLLAHLPDHIAERELRVIAAGLQLPPGQLAVDRLDEAVGPGNALLLAVRSERLDELFSAIGERGLRAESVAGEVVRQAQRYLAAGVPVGPCLADQLLLPLALAGGGAYRTLEPTLHTRTQIELIGRFVEVPMRTERLAADDWIIRVGEARPGPRGPRVD